MKFKYKFKKSMWVLFSIMYLLAIVCFVWNLIRLFNSISSTISVKAYGYISIVMCLALPILISIFISAIIISSYYTVKDKKLIVKFGFLKDEYSILDIDNIIKNIKSDKLVVNFKDEGSLNVGISKTDFDEFSASIIKQNKNVEYGETDE